MPANKDGGLLLFVHRNSLFLAWVVALAAVCGSLYFSEVMNFEPCKLCWIQRICMYPIVVLLGIATYRNDRWIIRYILPLSIIGGLFSTYHYLEEKVPAMAKILPCTVGIPCNADYINWLGFITIPLLAFVAFMLITIILWIGKRTETSEEE
ncbi:MAG: disulfide oxidoreductase [Bacilli bacterium]|nr:disulfide oxidoreductase [Bacilli bacterium]